MITKLTKTTMITLLNKGHDYNEISFNEGIKEFVKIAKKNA